MDIESRLRALKDKGRLPDVTRIGQVSDFEPRKQQQHPDVFKRAREEHAASASGNGSSDEVKRLKIERGVLTDSLKKERTKNEQLIAQIRELKAASAKHTQASSLSTRELARVRQELVSSKEALIQFAVRARTDREEVVRETLLKSSSSSGNGAEEAAVVVVDNDLLDQLMMMSDEDE